MRAPRIKIATLDAQGREQTVYPYWTSYHVGQDVRQYVAKARLTIRPCTTTRARAMLSEMYEGRAVACFVDGTRVLTGHVEDIQTGQDQRGQAPAAVITIADVLGQTVDDALPDGFTIKNRTVRQVVQAVLDPYGIEVVAGNEANRIATTSRTVTRTEATSVDNDPELARLIAAAQEESGSLVAAQEYAAAHPETKVTRLSETTESRALHPRPDESADKFLIRFTRDCGMLLFAGGDGKAILTTPNWRAAPQYELFRSRTDHTMREGRILSGTLVYQPGRVPDEVIVQGKVGRRGQSKIRASARNESAIFRKDNLGRKHRVLRKIDNSLRDQEDAQRKADTMLAEALLQSKTYECEVGEHGIGAALFGMDATAHVHDECCVVDDGELLDANLWIAGRQFYQPEKSSRLTTRIVCAWPGSWTAENAS